MKIIIATESYYPNIDGGAVAQYNLVHELSKMGHDVRVIAPGYRFKNYIEKQNNVTVYRTRGVTLPLYMRSKYHFSPFPIFKINKIIKDFKPDIVNVCSPYPIGVSTHICARKQDIPIIGSIHLLPDNMITPFLQFRFHTKLEEIFWKYLVKYFNRVDWAVIPTQTGLDMYKEQGLKTKVTPISNGINSKIFNPKNDGEYLREKYNLPKENIVLFAGRINEEKNLDVLIKAIPHVLEKINAHFLIVGGGGDYKKTLKNLGKRLKVGKNMTFTDFLDWDDYPNIYGVADLFAIPSEAELQSIVTLEAVASGLPVVVVNKGALPELASSGNGFIFESQNSKDMASKIVKILSDDKLRKEMSKKSLELVKKHTMQSVAKQYIKAYENAINAYNKKKISK